MLPKLITATETNWFKAFLSKQLLITLYPPCSLLFTGAWSSLAKQLETAALAKPQAGGHFHNEKIHCGIFLAPAQPHLVPGSIHFPSSEMEGRSLALSGGQR